MTSKGEAPIFPQPETGLARPSPKGVPWVDWLRDPTFHPPTPVLTHPQTAHLFLEGLWPGLGPPTPASAATDSLSQERRDWAEQGPLEIVPGPRGT